MNSSSGRVECPIVKIVRGVTHCGRQRIILMTPHALVALAEDLPER